MHDDASGLVCERLFPAIEQRGHHVSPYGLVAGTNKAESTLIWAALGAISGGLYAYTTEHVLTRSELADSGGSLAPNSSALVI